MESAMNKTGMSGWVVVSVALAVVFAFANLFWLTFPLYWFVAPIQGIIYLLFFIGICYGSRCLVFPMILKEALTTTVMCFFSMFMILASFNRDWQRVFREIDGLLDMWAFAVCSFLVLTALQILVFYCFCKCYEELSVNRTSHLTVYINHTEQQRQPLVPPHSYNRKMYPDLTTIDI